MMREDQRLVTPAFSFVRHSSFVLRHYDFSLADPSLLSV
jgi:hypothetical protein